MQHAGRTAKVCMHVTTTNGASGITTGRMAKWHITGSKGFHAVLDVGHCDV